MRSLSVLLLTLFALLVSGALHAAEPGEELRISLLTMGPGEHPFTKFGHTAIWVHDELEQRDEVYNYGTFSFDSPTLLADSVAGKLPYWLSVQSLPGTLRSYREQGRSLLASELELTPAQRLALRAALRENERPEHRYYRYDYFRDNCSTRARDIIARNIDSDMRQQAKLPASMSYRAHMLRLVADDPLLYVGLDLAVGRESDVPVTFWDEGWLPQRLHDLLAHTHVLRDGSRLPLIRSEHLLFAGEFPEPRAEPPHWFGRYAVLGMLVWSLFAVLGHLKWGRPRVRVVLGALYIPVGSLLGLLGCALCYLTFFSAHSAAAGNYNVLLTPPWLLALVPAGIGVVRGQERAWRIVRWTTIAMLGSIALALLFHVSTRAPQANAQELVLAFLVCSGIALSAKRQPY